MKHCNEKSPCYYWEKPCKWPFSTAISNYWRVLSGNMSTGTFDGNGGFKLGTSAISMVLGYRPNSAWSKKKLFQWSIFQHAMFDCPGCFGWPCSDMSIAVSETIGDEICGEIYSQNRVLLVLIKAHSCGPLLKMCFPNEIPLFWEATGNTILFFEGSLSLKQIRDCCFNPLLMYKCWYT